MAEHMRAWGLLVTVLLGLACGGRQPVSSTMPGTPAAPWSIVYSDGSANVHRWSLAAAGEDVSYDFDPVTPAESNTGSYSGGTPHRARVPAGDPRLGQLWHSIDHLAVPALAAATRDKGTGAFQITTPDGKRELLVRMSDELRAFDALARSF